MAKRRRTEIARIADPAARLVTYSKRRKGLFNKAYELSRLCGARAAVVVFSPAGKPCSFGDPSADEIISDYLRGGGCGDGGGGDGEVMPPMGLSQWAEWVQTEWNACATEEDLESLILKYEAVRDCARVKLKALEDSHILSEQEMDSLFESLEGQGPALAALLTEGEGILTSPENPAAGGGSSAVESTPAVSDLEGCGSNDAGGGSLRVGSNPSLSEDCFVDSHGFWSSPEESAVGGGNLEDCFVDSHGFWSWPENLAAGGGSSAVESIPVRSDIDGCGFNAPGGGSLGMASTPTCPDLEDCGFDPDDFLNLLEECVQDGDRDNFLTSPEESAFGGGNSGVEPALSDREGYGYDPIDFATLEDLGIPL